MDLDKILCDALDACAKSEADETAYELIMGNKRNIPWKSYYERFYQIRKADYQWEQRQADYQARRER